jgi:hypothetical protein
MGKKSMMHGHHSHGMAGKGHPDSAKSKLLGLLVVWSLAWKAASLWRAAGDKSVPWFATLFLVNSAGILDALYLFKFSPASQLTPKQRRKASRHHR